MANVAGAFVDLARSARTIDAVANQAALELPSDLHALLHSALRHERHELKTVLEDATQFPDAFVGAPDVQAGSDLLHAAIDRLDGAAVAARSAVKELGPAGRLDAIPVSSSTLAAELDTASREVRDAFRLLGGRRELPDYEPGPARDTSALVAAEDAPRLISARGHERVLSLIRAGLGVTKSLYGMQVRGASIPATGSAIIAPNHVANTDFIHAFRLTHRPIRFVGKAELFEKPLVAKALGGAGVIPIQQGNADGALNTVKTVLTRHDALIGIYPQGMRLHSNAPGAHGRAVAEAAAETGTPVIPIGTWGAGPREIHGGVRRQQVNVRVGEPIHPPDSPTLHNQRLLRERIARAQDDLVEQARQDHAARSSSMLPWKRTAKP